MSQTVSRFCPACRDLREVELVRGKTTVSVRGEAFEVDEEYYRCTTCAAEFDSFEIESDPLEQAYDLYRRAHDMVMPAEILEIRRGLNLTQKQLAELLGFGSSTLSRYENGALADPAHDLLLKVAKSELESQKAETLARFHFSERPAIEKSYDALIKQMEADLPK